MIQLLIIVALVLAVALTLAVIVSALRRSRRPDGVATFRRQIDALSPEARRPVVDKVQQLEEEAQPPHDEGGR